MHMPVVDKKPEPEPVPEKDPPNPNPPIVDPPVDPDNDNLQIDVDDALIEPPRDKVFENGPGEGKPANRPDRSDRSRKSKQ